MEAALAHAVHDKVDGAAYARSDLFERRRVLMEQGRSIWRAGEQAQRA